MATAKTVLREMINQAYMITSTYLSDLSDADLLVRPVPAMNHIAWQMGHLIAGEAKMIADMGHSVPDLPAGFAEAHTKETASSDDPKRFCSKEQYLTLMRQVHDATLAAIEATPDAKLDDPAPEGIREYAPTVASAFLIAGLHELMHQGQMVAVRRALGKPILF